MLIQFEGESDAVKEEMKARLNELIVSIFRKRPTLNYYQVRNPRSREQGSVKHRGIGIP